MAIYKPSRDRKKAIEDLLRDLDPSLRELARAILENMRQEELMELTQDDLHKLLEKYKKRASREKS